MKTKMMVLVAVVFAALFVVAAGASAQYSATFNEGERSLSAFQAYLELTPHYGQLIGISWESNQDKFWFLVDPEGGIYLNKQNFGAQEIAPTVLLATVSSLGRVVVESLGVRYSRLGVLELFLNGHRVAMSKIPFVDIRYTVGIGVFSLTPLGLKSTIGQFTVSELGSEFTPTE